MSKKKSKLGTYVGIGTAIFGTVGVVKRLKEARREGDTLRLADAVVSAASIVTTVALLVRDLRQTDAGVDGAERVEEYEEERS